MTNVLAEREPVTAGDVGDVQALKELERPHNGGHASARLFP